MATTDDLANVLRELGIYADSDMLSRFTSYMNGILEWNGRINLTAIKNSSDFIAKHFIDSVIPVRCPEWKPAKTVIDVGTGGGFPGVPLAIISPEKTFVLADSLAKRLKIVSELCTSSGITNCDVLHGRAEDTAHDEKYRQRFDICVSRAVGRLDVLSEYCLPFVKTGGAFISYKSGDVSRETSDAKKAIDALGGEITSIRKYKDLCPVSSVETDHCAVVIKKVKTTPASFPRKAGTPAKDPIR